jgi:hypothetical protein
MNGSQVSRMAIEVEAQHWSEIKKEGREAALPD